MSHRFIIQSILILLSVFVIFSYISPRISELQDKQIEVATYKDAVEKAERYNSILNGFLNDISSLSQPELQTLNRYLPEKIDEVAIAQDIESIVLRVGMLPLDIGVADVTDAEKAPVQFIQEEKILYDEFGMPIEDDKFSSQKGKVNTHAFKLSTSGRYSDFIYLLSALEGNNYPLKVTSLTVEPGSDELSTVYIYNIGLETFSFINSK